jgi:uncharacterized protein (TIGR02677 family)
LRPKDVWESVNSSGYHTEILDEAALDRLLDQLVEWGNLTRSHDVASVSKIEEFYRKRFLYHLSAAGEAAQRAIAEVEATVGRSGSLQAGMLARIRDLLRSLAEPPGEGSWNAEKLKQAFFELFGAFDSLAQEANRFIAELNRHLADERLEDEAFCLRKEALLAYISRFVEQLRMLSGEISTAMEAVEVGGIQSLIEIAARSQDLPPALGGVDPAFRWMEQQRGKWEGIRVWFLGGTHQPSPTVDHLAEAAVGAVVGLARALGRLNERRNRPVDRKADFLALAKWFASATEDAEAHHLWRRAFGLYPARHFQLKEEDEGLAHPGTSWWEAPPVLVPVRLRVRGILTRAGHASPVPDRTDQKHWMQEERRREKAELAQAYLRFSGRNAIPLDELETLGLHEFEVFLALLDEVLAAPRSREGTRQMTTLDGRHIVTLLDPATPGESWVTVETPRGRLRCRNYTVRLEALAPRQKGQAGLERGVAR